MSATWPRVPLGDLLKRSDRTVFLHPETTYREITVRMNGKGVIERRQVQGVEIASDRRYEASAGQFIISRIDARNGASGLVPAELNGAVVTNDFPLFNVAKERLEPTFLHWLSKTASFVDLCKRASEGTTNRVRLSEGRFTALEISLPPICEQRRIVAHIEELAAKIHEAQNVRRTLADEAELLYTSAISRLISARHYDRVRLGEILGEWGLKNGKSIKSIPAEAGIRCLTLSALRRGFIDVSKSKPVPMQLDEARSYLVTKGDVFVVRGNGTKTLCGRAGIVLDEVEETIFPDLFIKISLPHDVVDPRFFVSVWNAPGMRSWIEEKAKTTSGIWKINQGHIESAEIPLPPIAEQRRIIAELDALQVKVDAVKTLQNETATALDAMLPAILDKAFKGELV